MRDRYASRGLGIAEYVAAVAKRLGPADRRGVLRADAAAGRQDAGALPPRQIEYDADVPAFAHAADAHHRRGERFVDRQSQAEQ